MTIYEYIYSNRRFRNFCTYGPFEWNFTHYMKNRIRVLNPTGFHRGEAEFDMKLDRIVENEIVIARANGENYMEHIIPTIDHTWKMACTSIWDLFFLFGKIENGWLKLDFLNFKPNKLSWWTHHLDNPKDRETHTDNNLRGLRDWNTMKSLIFFNSECYDNELNDFKPEMWTDNSVDDEVKERLSSTGSRFEYKYLCKGCDQFTNYINVQSFGVFGKNKNILDKHDCFYLCDLCTKHCMVPCKSCNTALGIPLDGEQLPKETIYHYNPDAQSRFKTTKRARHE